MPSLTLEATSGSGAGYDYEVPTAADLVDGDVAVGCEPPPSGTFPLGSASGTCSATDTAGNMGPAASWSRSWTPPRRRSRPCRT